MEKPHIHKRETRGWELADLEEELAKEGASGN